MFVCPCLGMKGECWVVCLFVLHFHEWMWLVPELLVDGEWLLVFYFYLNCLPQGC